MLRTSIIAIILLGGCADPSDGPPRAARTVLGVSRRLGAGVSSFPLWRWYALIEGPTTAPDDDLLLEVKEIVDPPFAGELARRPAAQYRNNAERVVEQQRTLQLTRRNDAYLGWATDGQHAFRVRERTKYQKNVDVVRLGEDLGADWDVDDLVEHARLSGQLLAAAHLRGAPDAGIEQVADDGLVAETTDFAVRYGAQVLRDRQTLAELLADHGPMLGFVNRETR